eukprot:1590651-Prymnesium_polylepis.2
MRAAIDPLSYAPACSARYIQMTICAQCRWGLVMAGHGGSLRSGVSHGIARVHVYVGAAVRVMGLGRRAKSVMSLRMPWSASVVPMAASVSSLN